MMDGDPAAPVSGPGPHLSEPASRPLLVVLHGVNLDLLGERPSAHYGSITLDELEDMLVRKAADYGWDCVCLQTNHEGTFVQYLHDYRRADALLINPGAWTHYSYAIRDALEIITAPIGEVHLSDVGAREEWRRHSVVSEVVSFTIAGKGPEGYLQAVGWLVALARSTADESPD